MDCQSEVGNNFQGYWVVKVATGEEQEEESHKDVEGQVAQST